MSRTSNSLSLLIIRASLFLLVSNISTVVCQVESCDYYEYFLEINKAEKRISENDLALAVEHYEIAFKKNTALLKDLYNASICYSNIGDDNASAQCLIRIVELGGLKKIVRKRIFREARRTDVWKKTKGSRLTKKSGSAQNRGTDLLRDKTDSLFNIDQEFRLKRGSYSVYGDTIKTLDSLNMICMLELISEFGYPGNISYGQDYPGRVNKPYIVIRHHYQNKNNITEILTQALCDGEISPFMYAELEDKKASWNGEPCPYLSTSTVVFNWGLFGTKSKRHSSEISQKEILRINANREAIGLADFLTFVKLLEYEKTWRTPFEFGFYEGVVYVNGKPPK